MNPENSDDILQAAMPAADHAPEPEPVIQPPPAKEKEPLDLRVPSGGYYFAVPGWDKPED